MTEQRAPAEFRYWENLPKVARRRAIAKRLLGFDPAPPEDVARTFASMYYDADPLAEAFVHEVYFTRGAEAGRALLEQALASGVESIPDAPPSLKALFEDIETDPDWVDAELVEQGARVFRRWGTAVFRFAGAITLTAYAESSVAKPLALTGTYAGRSARNRFLETAAFWIAVSEPGGLKAGAAGRASALRVRIMHVFVREKLLKHPEWKLEAWGVPISQADATLTLMGGSFGPALALHAMGYRTSKQEILALMHFWRYVGHLMGVRPRWYPSTLTEAAQLSFMTFIKGAHRAGEDERRLCQAYASAFAPDDEAPLSERVRGGIAHRVHLGYTRFFMPGAAYRRNDLPFAWPWALHPLLQAPFIFTAETLRRRFPSLETVADRVARRARKRWLSRHFGDRPAEYRPAERFTR